MSLYSDLLASPAAARRYLVILEPWTGATTTTLYYSDHGHVTGPDDDPPHTVFPARLAAGQGFSLRRELFGAGRIGGRSVPQPGRIVLANADGELDPLLGYGWDGRPARLLLGGPGWALADYGVVWAGHTLSASADDTTITLTLEDPVARLDVPLPASLYTGAGGYEGGADHAGRPRPLTYGRCRAVTGHYLQAISGRDVYQVHDGEVEAVPAGYSAGVALTPVAPPAGPGEYSVDLAAGRVTLGGSGLNTTICWDVDGHAPAGAWAGTVVQVARAVASAAGIAATGGMDLPALEALDAEIPYVVGLHVADGGMTVAEALDRLLGSAGAWWGMTRDGLLTAGLVAPPAAEAAAAYDDAVILSLERLDVSLPAWRVAVDHRRCWTVHGPAQIAATATEASRTFLSAAYRSTVAEDAAVLTAHPRAVDHREETLLDDPADAAAVAGHLLAVLAERAAYRVRLKTQPFARALGETVLITSARYGLSAGRRLVIVGLEEDAGASEVTMTVWG